MNPKKYKLSFSSKITRISNAEINQNISLAGLEKLRPLMPTNIDLDNNPDLMGIVLNAAVGNKSNRNHDAVTNKTLVSIAKNFLYKNVDINHDRSKNIGVIVNAGFSEFGSNKILTSEEAETSENPVNLSLAILLWTSVLGEKYVKLLEASADENSPDYAAISASWEMWFDEYDVAVSDDGLLTGAKIFSGEEASKLEQYLPSNKGKGYTNGKMVFRVLKHDENNIVLPAGIGLVEHPAAHVKGLEIINSYSEGGIISEENSHEIQSSISTEFVVKKESISKIGNDSVYGFCPTCGAKGVSRERRINGNDTCENGHSYLSSKSVKAQLKTEEDNEDQGTNKKEKHMKKNYGYCPDCNEASDDSEMENEMVTCGKCGKKTEMASWSKDKISKSNDNSVKTNKDSNMNKPKTLKELTEANVKELTLAEFNDLVADALREANTKYEADVNQYKNGIEQLTKEKEQLSASVSENATKLTDTQNELTQLKEQFNKLVEANTIREQELKFNERMTAVASKFDLSDKQKEVVVNRIKTIKTDDEFVAYASELELFIAKTGEKAKEISTASVTNTDNVVKDGVDNASKENVVIPNTQTTPVDFITMAKKAFSKENLVITYSK